MNPNEDKNTSGLGTTDDLEHIREIENLLEKRSVNTEAGSDHVTPVRKYVRHRPTNTNENDANSKTQVVDLNTRIIDSVGDTKHPDNTHAKSQEKPSSDSGVVKQFNAHTHTDAVQKNSEAQKRAPKKTDPEKHDEIVSSRHPIKSKHKEKNDASDKEYTPLLTENDDFELDENGDSDMSNATIGALTSIGKAIVYLVAVLAVSILLAITIINVANDVFAFVKDEEPVTVVVPENCDTKELSEILADSGVIKYPSIFEFYIKFKGKEGEYIPGTYEISPMLNYDYIIAKVKPSKAARTEVVVTIPEGYSTDQIVNLLVEKGLGTYDGYVRAINEYDFDYEFLKDADNFSPDRFWRLDGYLYPDTYYYYSDSTEETIIYKMLENFNNKFTEEYYARAEELGMSVDELITLASMIQKEVRYADEYGNVSSVFHNRLKNLSSFPHLDSDATIVYAIEHDTGERPETLTDTSYDSPYNTYKCIGLPPGPIANPSIEAIRYAMYPSDTNYYYFVSGTDGRTVFSKTYAEHLTAISELY